MRETPFATERAGDLHMITRSHSEISEYQRSVQLRGLGGLGGGRINEGLIFPFALSCMEITCCQENPKTCL